MARKRNTLANTASKQDPFGSLVAGGEGIPAPSPETTASLYSQLAGLYQQYQAQLAQLRLQRQGLRGAARTARADIRAQGIEQMAQTVNQALERDVVGSSFDLAARVGVRADVARAQEQVRQDLIQGVAGTRLDELQAGLAYQQGVFGLESQVAAQQATAAAQALLQNTIIGGQEAQSDMLRQFYRRLLEMVMPSGQRPEDQARLSAEEVRARLGRLLRLGG